MVMRIAHVVLSLDVGGQERLILNLSRVLASRGHDVSVISLTPGGTLRPEFGPIRIVDVPKGPGLDRALIPRLFRAFRDLRLDAVHTHNSAPLIYAALAARLAGVPRVVHTKHGNATFTRGSLLLSRAGARLVSAFAAVSSETADAARQNEMPPEARLHVLPNGIPLDQFSRDGERRLRIRAELGIPGGAVVIGTVGRMVMEKNYPLLVRAASGLLGDGVRLVLVGDGPERGAIERAITPDILPFVTLTGLRSDVPAVLSAFDVFALSSDTEGLPLVVPEAMASHLSVVATRVGGLPGIVPEDVGILVAKGDAAALADALRRLTSNEALRERMGGSAVLYAHGRFSIETTTTRYEALYEGRTP